MRLGARTADGGPLQGGRLGAGYIRPCQEFGRCSKRDEKPLEDFNGGVTGSPFLNRLFWLLRGKWTQ